MNLFQRPHYDSEATQFLEALRAKNPKLDAEQRAGRALLWDQPVDRDWNAEADAGRVEQKPYVYQTEPTLR